MELVSAALTVVHLLAVIAWLGGMIFHIVVLDPVFRKNEVTFQSAYLLALMEGRFRKLVGTSIALLVASGAAKAHLMLGTSDALFHSGEGRYVLLKVALTAAMLVIFVHSSCESICSMLNGFIDSIRPHDLGRSFASHHLHSAFSQRSAVNFFDPTNFLHLRLFCLQLPCKVLQVI